MIEVEVPNQGLTITEAIIVKWHRQPGEVVKQGDILFEIETDKAIQEIESPTDGFLMAILAQEGDVVPLGRVVAQIGTEAEKHERGLSDMMPVPGSKSQNLQYAVTQITDFSITQPLDPAMLEALLQATEEARTSGKAPVVPEPPPSEPQISPRARRAAALLKVDLSKVIPTGADGHHIREKDIFRADEEETLYTTSVTQSALSEPPPISQPFQSAPVSVPEPLPNMTEPMAPLSAVEPVILPTSLHEDVVPYPTPDTRHPTPSPGRYRQLIAQRTTESFRNTPHFYLTREVPVNRFVSLRAEMVGEVEAQTGVRISVTDLFMKALGLSLRAFPVMNSQWENGQMVPLTEVNIGLAVETPEGLMAPVLRSVDIQPLATLAQERQALVLRAKEGRCRPEELTGGSFTLSNLGTFGVDQFEAIIVPPQSGILAVGAIKSRPFVMEEQLVVSKTVFLTLSVDHRVVDGAEAARFFDHLAHLIERPMLLCAF